MNGKIRRLVSFKREKWKMGFNEQAKQGLMKEMGIKTKCGLRRAHFGQNRFWRREREKS